MMAASKLFFLEFDQISKTTHFWRAAKTRTFHVINFGFFHCIGIYNMDKKDSKMVTWNPMSRSRTTVVTKLHKWAITGDFTSFQSPGEFKSFLKWLLYGDVTSDLTDFEVKETSKMIDILCRIICNHSKRDQSPKRSLAKDGHEVPFIC